ncbi:SurA N-terminal domain-containing protein [Brevibacillus fulvus]|uniref:Parvulin-like peptidyl-prolyl isomerase n=1 Tax=Brevibacillus fulvus TaxID=1125967 RepID=A0A939BNC2_9BACL|nr:SurA N-terminal domain-containing protein [Brevibacillus fulvus]MBM7588795.1 parvulin-like peptidyl-prolyl isomerase [Brevibacillus fulvus]
MKKFDLSMLTIAILILALVGVSITTQSSSANETSATHEVVARVNGESITQDQFYQLLKDKYGDKVLDDTIDQLLVKQEAAKNKIVVTDDELNKEFSAYKERIKDNKNYLEDLKADPDLDSKLKDRMYYKLLEKKAIDKLIPVTDQELQDYFTKHKDVLWKKATSLAEVKDSVRSRVLDKKTNDWIKSLREKAALEITDSVLEHKLND